MEILMQNRLRHLVCNISIIGHFSHHNKKQPYSIIINVFYCNEWPCHVHPLK